MTGAADGMRCDTDGNMWAGAPPGVQDRRGEREPIGMIRLPENCANVSFGGTKRPAIHVREPVAVHGIRRRHGRAHRVVDLPQQLVADKRQPLAVRGPGGNIDGSLPSNNFVKTLTSLFSTFITQHHVLVFRMPADVFVVGQERHALAVRGNMREPVVEFVWVTCSWLEPSGCMRQIWMLPLRSEFRCISRRANTRGRHPIRSRW